MVLKRRVPLLKNNLRTKSQSQSLGFRSPVLTGAYLLRSSSDLGCDKLLEVTDGVVRVAFHTDFLPETIVAGRDISRIVSSWE